MTKKVHGVKVKMASGNGKEVMQERKVRRLLVRHFYGGEERRIEKSIPIYEIPPELKNGSKSQRSEKSEIISRNVSNKFAGTSLREK